MSITSFTPGETYPRFRGLVSETTVPATVATATAVTLTAAQILGGLILQDPSGGGVTTTLPTFALLYAAMQGAVVGASVQFVIRNTADASETITIAAGTGGTLSGSGASTTTVTIAQNASKILRIVFTSSTGEPSGYGVPDGYTCYSIVGGTH